MRELMVCLIAGTLALTAPAFALAPQPSDASVAQRAPVVIAPPETALARDIKTDLRASYDKAAPDTRAYEEAQKIYYFYGARHFAPIWLKTASDGSVSFSPAADKILAVFKNATAEGFRPSDYLTPAIDLGGAGTDPQKLAAVEAAFSASTVRYAQNAFGGRVAPQTVSPDIDPTKNQIDPADLLIKLGDSSDPDKILYGFDPKEREFVQLKAALAKFDDTSAPLQVKVPSGPTLNPGATQARVALLRQRLHVPAPETATNRYGPDLVSAVKAFQKQMGLSVDGIVGRGTLAALNADAPISRDDIIANMERWRWLPRDSGKFHVLVNIPEFRVDVIDHDQTIYSTRIVVGKPSTPTPVFSNEIRYVVVNPYWNVPASIVAKEIIPHMEANPDYLNRENMQVLQGAKVVNAAAINWANASGSHFPFSVRQRPGASNALGRVKFLFPNSHAVYLHDTDAKYLFAKSVRAYSHGCVRVQNPMDFATALLKYEPDLNGPVLESMYGQDPRWVPLKVKIPVNIAYFTLRVDPDGTIHSFADIYGINKKLIGMLNG